MNWMIDFDEAAIALHRDSIVLDGHADTPQRFADDGWHWAGDALGIGQLSSETASAGGLNGGFFIAWPEPAEWAGRFAERTRGLIASIHAEAALPANNAAVCMTAADIRSAQRAGRYAALIGIEGGHAIDNSLDTLREFHGLGARYMTLTWANSNDWCGSSGDGSDAPGLTAFGRDVVHEMNRLGMMVDVSHVSDRAFWDVMEASNGPVIASHSCARALCGAARNLTDDMAKAISAKGGVVMVNFFAAFLSDTWRAGWNAIKPEMLRALEPVRHSYHDAGRPMPYFAELAVEREYARRITPAPFSILVDHFDYLLRLVGTEHVGIGSDFDGIPLSVEGMETAADLPKITAALLKRGWRPDELRGLLGENLLRVMQSAERAAG